MSQINAAMMTMMTTARSRSGNQVGSEIGATSGIGGSPSTDGRISDAVGGGSTGTDAVGPRCTSTIDGRGLVDPSATRSSPTTAAMTTMTVDALPRRIVVGSAIGRV